MKRVDRLHPKPLPEPACYYSDGSTYPDRIRAGFTDGHTLTYRVDRKMPGPHLITEKERKRQCRECGGYQYREDLARFLWAVRDNERRHSAWVETLLRRFSSLRVS